MSDEETMFPASVVPVRVFEVRQMPPIAKQPLVKDKPFAKVEDAVVEVMLSKLAERPPANVDVPWPAATVIAPPKVEVAVVVAFKFPTVN